MFANRVAVPQAHGPPAWLSVPSLVLAVLTVLTPEAARAEGWLTDGVFGIGSGVQGGDPGTGSVAWSRARTRLFSGIDLRSDESQSSGMGFYGFVEIERRATLGAEVRYQRWWTPTIGFHVGAIGTIAPETMVGIGAGARFGFPIGNKATLFVEPGLAAFPLGSDLPDDSVLVWGSIAGGIGVAL